MPSITKEGYTMSIYGKYQDYLPLILKDMRQEITVMNEEYQKSMDKNCMNILKVELNQKKV